jgi:integrase
MPRLLKKVVDATTPDPNGKDIFVWDTEVKGFGLKVTPKGRKVYVLQYRNGEGRSRRCNIGVHGAPFTPDQARTRAIELLRDIAAGIDPLDAKADAKAAMTIKELCAVYLDACDKGLVLGKRGKGKKSSTLATDRGRIERHILPLLGTRKVRELTTPDITRFMRDVAGGKTAVDVKTGFRGRAIVEGGAGTAARTVGLLGGILSFAVSEGVIAANPATGVKRPADNRRDVRLTAEQYRRFGAALQQAADEGETPLVIAAAWLLALTGCRRGEIEALKWSEVDEAGRCLRLADSKEGASVRPAGSPAFDVLAMLERRAGCDFVMAARSGNDHFKGLPSAWKRLQKRADLPELTPHGLRHGFASVANDLGYTEPTIAAMLGHAGSTVTSRYIHHLDSALIAAADRVARQIHAYMTGADAVESP